MNDRGEVSHRKERDEEVVVLPESGSEGVSNFVPFFFFGG